MVYLAMTAAELRSNDSIPQKIAWMACHFSPYGTGLTNLPKVLPEGSLLILNDRTPVHGHDPHLIADTLCQSMETLQCSALLLDFQRPGCSESAAIVAELIQLPCPVIVSQYYAEKLRCPIFLPPVPLNMPPEDYLQPYKGRDIWLDAALDGQVWTVTESGSSFCPLSPGEEPDCPHFGKELLCHYRIDTTPQKATFTLRRTRNDLQCLLSKCKDYGLTGAVGLWQELVHKL